MMRHLTVGLVALSVLGCEPMSKYGPGRDDAVRYQLPRGAMAIFENADTIEVFAIGDRLAIDDPDRLLVSDHRPYFARLNAVAIARIELAPYQFPHVIRSTYRSMSRGSGTLGCYLAHHAVRARRGTETFEFSVCLMCIQMYIPAANRYIAVDPWPIVSALNTLFEEQSGLHFDPQTLQWVSEAGDRDPHE